MDVLCPRSLPASWLYSVDWIKCWLQFFHLIALLLSLSTWDVFNYNLLIEHAFFLPQSRTESGKLTFSTQRSSNWTTPASNSVIDFLELFDFVGVNFTPYVFVPVESNSQYAFPTIFFAIDHHNVFPTSLLTVSFCPWVIKTVDWGRFSFSASSLGHFDARFSDLLTGHFNKLCNLFCSGLVRRFFFFIFRMRCVAFWNELSRRSNKIS